MVGVPQVVAVIAFEVDAASMQMTSVSAGGGYEKVAEDLPQGTPRSCGDGRADRVVAGTRQQRHVVAVALEAGVMVAVPPIVVDHIDEAQVFDPSSADSLGSPPAESVRPSTVRR